MTSREAPPSYRATARLIGALFLLSTAAYMLGSGMVEPLLAGPVDPQQLGANRTRLVGGVLLQLVNTAAVVGIGVLFFPLVRRHSEPIALGYVGARIMESALLTLGGIAALALLGVSQDLGAAGALLTAGSRAAYHVGMIALGLGSLPLCYALYRWRLIPRALAALGLLGYATLLAGSGLELFGFDLKLLHNLPGGIFELLLPLWLLARGFSQPAAAAGPAAPARSVLV